MFLKTIKFIILSLVVFTFFIASPKADAQTQTGSIVGRTFIDENLDGKFQFGEEGVAGITITLIDLATSKTRTSTSNAQGVYEFLAPIPFGSYNISVTQKPLGHRSTSPKAFNFELFQDLKGIDFGFFPATATVEGFVFSDLNKNGVREANEPGVPGIQVILKNIERTTATLGFFRIIFVKPGIWELKVFPPSGFFVTTRNLIFNVPFGFEGVITKNVGISKI